MGAATKQISQSELAYSVVNWVKKPANANEVEENILDIYYYFWSTGYLCLLKMAVWSFICCKYWAKHDILNLLEGLSLSLPHTHTHTLEGIQVIFTTPGGLNLLDLCISLPFFLIVRGRY